MNIKESTFEGVIDGKQVDIYTLSNNNGIEIKITNYGGKVVSLKVPDKKNIFDDIVLGYETFGEYISGNTYFGAIIGRYANRIANAKFHINDEEYLITRNEENNHLHGGIKGFDNMVWEAGQHSDDSLRLSFLSEAGDEGYPGNLSVQVTYSLNDNNEFKIDYFATTDKTTIVNLTHHSFFNLSGVSEKIKDITGHEIMINADFFTPVKGNFIPTGEIRSVKGTPMDFTSPVTIEKRIKSDYDQIRLANGYDHNFVLNESDSPLKLAARVHEPVTGRTMEVFTTKPGIQFYTGNNLNGSETGKNGIRYYPRVAFCLEPQYYPDSPNRKEFPSPFLKPGEEYKHSTIFSFSV